MSLSTMMEISREEIEWVKSKHAGIVKTGRRLLIDALEIGQWFVEAQERMGNKKSARGGTWMLWLRATFPELGRHTIGNYMRLARGRAWLEQQYDLSANGEINRSDEPNISKALSLIRARDRKGKEDSELTLPPVEFDEPLLILRDQLKSYVYQQFQLQYLAEQIRFRIKNAKLGRRQIRQAVEWAIQEHPELREMILKAFLR
jgi:hypothetical protein